MFLFLKHPLCDHVINVSIHDTETKIRDIYNENGVPFQKNKINENGVGGKLVLLQDAGFHVHDNTTIVSRDLTYFGHRL